MINDMGTSDAFFKLAAKIRENKLKGVDLFRMCDLKFRDAYKPKEGTTFQS